MKKFGMVYKINYSPDVLKHDIAKLAKADKINIKQAIDSKLIHKPKVFGKPLGYSLKGYRSFRAGSYRVVFKINKDILFVTAIIHRSKVYKTALKRLFE